MVVSRGLSIAMALTACIVGAFGVESLAREVTVYRLWPRVEASVEQIDFKPMPSDPYGNINVKLRYWNGLANRSVWTYQYFLPGQGIKFARKYAVGTRHIVWLDPGSYGRAEVELGWNINRLIGPLILFVVCFSVFLPVRYFWRL